ncbi:hypothetical protein UB32_03210 [Mesobacillus subterraneus]|uniref:Uncharacterized protein n=1 Tax=Mesobacillus subterraneus TaxID=285983 RepID=A0A0D6ZCT9_9BACI|nr:hypothetical protein UB32_03210 [Mesobacillus subterraneus]
MHKGIFLHERCPYGRSFSKKHETYKILGVVISNSLYKSKTRLVFSNRFKEESLVFPLKKGLQPR